MTGRIITIDRPYDGVRQWTGQSTLTGYKNGHRIIETTMPDKSYPLPKLARQLVLALHDAEEVWELRVYEDEDTVQVTQYHPHEWPCYTTWHWKNGRRTNGPAVRDTLIALAVRPQERSH